MEALGAIQNLTAAKVAKIQAKMCNLNYTESCLTPGTPNSGVLLGPSIELLLKGPACNLTLGSDPLEGSSLTCASHSLVMKKVKRAPRPACVAEAR